MEKFMDIKCRYSSPPAVVLVATIRALKMHGGGPRSLPDASWIARTPRKTCRCWKLALPISASITEIARQFGVPVVVAINQFKGTTRPTDRPAQRLAETGALPPCPPTTGPRAARRRALAETFGAASSPATSSSSTRWTSPSRRRSRSSPQGIRRDGGKHPEANAQIAAYEKAGYGGLPICMAKTLSISHDPALKCATGFTLPVREVAKAAPAHLPVVQEMRTMPGLPSKPVFFNVLDENGRWSDCSSELPNFRKSWQLPPASPEVQLLEEVGNRARMLALESRQSGRMKR